MVNNKWASVYSTGIVVFSLLSIATIWVLYKLFGRKNDIWLKILTAMALIESASSLASYSISFHCSQHKESFNYKGLNFFIREAFIIQSLMIGFLYFESTTLALSYCSDSMLQIREK